MDVLESKMKPMEGAGGNDSTTDKKENYEDPD